MIPFKFPFRWCSELDLPKYDRSSSAIAGDRHAWAAVRVSWGRPSCPQQVRGGRAPAADLDSMLPALEPSAAHVWGSQDGSTNPVPTHALT